MEKAMCILSSKERGGDHTPGRPCTLLSGLFAHMNPAESARQVLLVTAASSCLEPTVSQVVRSSLNVLPEKCAVQHPGLCGNGSNPHLSLPSLTASREGDRHAASLSPAELPVSPGSRFSAYF